MELVRVCPRRRIGFSGMLCTTMVFLAASMLGAAPLKMELSGPDADHPCSRLAESVLRDAGLKVPVTLRINPNLGDREAFTIDSGADGIIVTGGRPAGMLYGAQEVVCHAKAGEIKKGLRLSQRPDFEVRGNALFLMKDCSYNFQLSPEEFPWFFDRPLLLRYLDYLFANRFNAVFLWSGNLFPSIVEMPKYPDSSDLPKVQLHRNQEQFRWFTDECAKRNINVLLHFYQIHIPVSLARSRHIPVAFSQPNDFLREYMRYVLTRFLTEFDSVGLYVCPGEVLAPRYQPEWIRDVIFAAARESGHNPVIVVRDWSLDAELFKKICVGQYDNLYTELKHNVEMIVSPVPDLRHKFWKSVAKKHIVNLHEVADVKPFRWGSPVFVKEMVSEWRKMGLDGAEVYGMVSWRFPYSLDKLQPDQRGYWPPGPKLFTFDRDTIWLEAIGRYLWNTDRDPRYERAYWSKHLAGKFGNRKAGNLIRRWYEVTGPIMPGLQNVTAVANMNVFPTAIAKELRVDDILSARASEAELKTSTTAAYPSKPVDTYFFERYKREYRQPDLQDRVSMPVARYVMQLADGRKVTDRMTPDRVCRLLTKMAGESVGIARQAEHEATLNKDEAARFVTDSQALVLIARFWTNKVDAAIRKRLWRATRKWTYAEKSLRRLDDSVKNYTELVALTDKTYLNATDLHVDYNWHEGLKAQEKDLAAVRAFLESRRNSREIAVEPASFEVYGAVGKEVVVSFSLPASAAFKRATFVFNARDLDGSHPGDEGVLRIGKHEYKLPPTGDGVTKSLQVDVDPGLLKAGRNTVVFVIAGRPVPSIGYSITDCCLLVEKMGHRISRGLSPRKAQDRPRMRRWAAYLKMSIPHPQSDNEQRNTCGASLMEDRIAGIMIVLKSKGKHLLFLLLGSDGSINRIGTGNEFATTGFYPHPHRSTIMSPTPRFFFDTFFFPVLLRAINEARMKR